MTAMRTQVAIIGAGPAGLLLSHLLDAHDIDSVVLETRSRAHVEARIRAGILEHSTVELLDSVGLGAQVREHGDEHGGIYLQWPEARHHIDFRELVGHGVWLYGQTELTKELGKTRDRAGQEIHYEVSETTPHDIETERPSVTALDRDGKPLRVDAEVIVGCDGSFGPSRSAIPEAHKAVWQRDYPYSWLGVLAEVAPSTDELIYAWHPEGFALHSMRSATRSRLYLQVPAGTDIADWPDERIWEQLATRLGAGQPDWRLHEGPILEKNVLPMRSFVQEPLRHGRLFLAGDAGHIVPPTGAKGLNLAVADVALLAPALAALLREGDARQADAYSEAALRRIWRCTHFAWWMTTMLHHTGDPFDEQLQLSQLRWIAGSTAGASGLAENYTGLPIG